MSESVGWVEVDDLLKIVDSFPEGESRYPNHHIMKRNRLEKLEQTGGKCEVCGKKARCNHHLDGTDYNHSLNNLVVLCARCHVIHHIGKSPEVLKEREVVEKKLDELKRSLKGDVKKHLGKRESNEQQQPDV